MEKQINAAVRQFANLREQSRRFLRSELGADVDPNHCFADFLWKIANNDAAGLEKEYGAFRTKTAMAESGGTTGGYLVPSELRDSLLQIVAERALFRPRAFVQPMASATLDLPLPDITSAYAAGVSPFFAGVQMYWTYEAQTRTETEPQFKDVNLRAWELSGYAVASNVLMQDGALGLEAFLMTLFGQSIAWYEDYAFINGNGVGKPLGVLNAPATISVTRNTGGSVVLADLANMSNKILPRSWERAFWVFHPTVWTKIVQITAGAWQINQPIGEGPNRPHAIINGQAAFVSEKVSTLGTRGDVLLIDPALYVIGDRQAIEIDASAHVNFLKSQMTWRIVERVDGQPWLEKPITLQDAASTVSPFVALT